MKQKIGIINYNTGNIASIRRSLKFFNADYVMVNTHKDLKNCEKIILPGIGSYQLSMDSLKSKKLDVAIKNFFKQGKEILAICLGMQLLLTESEEFGNKKGLDILSGKVESMLKFGVKLPIPHIGWCRVNKDKDKEKNSIISFENKINDRYFYFAHSLICNFKTKYKFTKFNYGGKNFVASVQHKNIIATQFHPELSGSIGLEIYKFFLEK